MSFKLLTIFSNDIINLLNNSEEFNVAIYVGEGDNQKVFQAHSLILRARSSYFHTALSKQWVRKEGDDNILRQPNISPQVFEIILNYIYSGTISLIDRDIMEILEILAASDELLLNDLLDFIQEYLIETKNEWLHSSILKIYQTSLAHGSCEKLREFILATISSDPELLFKSANFLSLDVSLLTPILKRDDLDMAEDEDESYGPCFGDKDLSMQGNFSHTDSCSCKEDDYEAPIVKHRKFSAVEYEVFKVIKK
ncbi:unnamed protein product [Rhizophagus irregularis]|nr:unnamed protein product [Rhizophagus irregularis]